MANLFILPPVLDDLGETKLFEKVRTFSECHYTKANPVESFIKTRHFESALRLTKDYFGCNVIDFGCGDGPFLPSLAKYFEHVAGIDFAGDQLEISSKVCVRLKLENVELICASSSDILKIKNRLGSRNYKVLFLLETLEHIGEEGKFYESKVEFLKEAFSLLEDDGIIVASVPVMVGLPFFLQRTGLWLLRKYIEPIGFVDFFKAVVFKDTRKLESGWNPGKHLGFNHRYLEDALRGKISLVKKKNLFFQMVYVFRRI